MDAYRRAPENRPGRPGRFGCLADNLGRNIIGFEYAVQPDGVDVPVYIGRTGLPTTLRWHLADVPCVALNALLTGKAGRP
jgi:hypothetical protein